MQTHAHSACPFMGGRNTWDTDNELTTWAADAIDNHARGDNLQRQGLEAFRMCGRALNNAKEKLPHGQFGPWMTAQHFPFSDRWGRKLMELDREWDRIEEIKRRLPDLAGVHGVEQSLALLSLPAPQATGDSIYDNDPELNRLRDMIKDALARETGEQAKALFHAAQAVKCFRELKQACAAGGYSYQAVRRRIPISEAVEARYRSAARGISRLSLEEVSALPRDMISHLYDVLHGDEDYDNEEEDYE